jgi:membrane-associated protein
VTAALTDWVFHLDNHLAAIASSHGALVYGVMFGFIFIETGVVVLPFLPGDSLLFVAGALAAKGVFSLPVLAPALAIAAIAGDTLNFAVGGAMRKHVLDAAAWPGLASCWVPGISSGTCLGSAII